MDKKICMKINCESVSLVLFGKIKYVVIIFPQWVDKPLEVVDPNLFHNINIAILQ